MPKQMIANPLCPVYVDFVEDPSVLAPALGICGDVSEADSWLFASCGEDGRRERNDLRQLSEVLGGGGPAGTHLWLHSAHASAIDPAGGCASDERRASRPSFVRDMRRRRPRSWRSPGPCHERLHERSERFCVPERKIAPSVHEAARDKARAIAKTEAYAVSCRERKKVEMLFAHLKRILRLDRLRLRGPSGAKDEF